MSAIPLFFDLEGKKIIVVGAGTSAQIRLNTISMFTNSITVVAPEISKAVARLCENKGLKLIKRPFLAEDLYGVSLVFASANNSVNNAVYAQAKANGIPCCLAQGGGDFLLPSCKREGDITAAVSTNGKFPMLAKKICADIDLSAADNITLIGDCRRFILENIEDKKQAKILLAEIADYANDALSLKKILERIGYELH